MWKLQLYCEYENRGKCSELHTYKVSYLGGGELGYKVMNWVLQLLSPFPVRRERASSLKRKALTTQRVLAYCFPVPPFVLEKVLNIPQALKMDIRECWDHAGLFQVCSRIVLCPLANFFSGF